MSLCSVLINDVDNDVMLLQPLNLFQYWIMNIAIIVIVLGTVDGHVCMRNEYPSQTAHCRA